MINFDSIRGFLRSPDFNQKKRGWFVHPEPRPTEHGFRDAEVIILPAEQYEQLREDVVREVIVTLSVERRDLCGHLVAEWIKERFSIEIT